MRKAELLRVHRVLCSSDPTGGSGSSSRIFERASRGFGFTTDGPTEATSERGRHPGPSGSARTRTTRANQHDRLPARIDGGAPSAKRSRNGPRKSIPSRRRRRPGYCRGRRVADKRYIGEALGRQSDFRNIPKRLTDTRGPRQPECGCLRGWLGSCCSGVHADQRGSLCKREPTEEFSPVELLSVSRAQADLPSAYRSVRYHSA